MNTVILPPPLARRIEEEGQNAYPQECCGAMIGVETADRREVRRLEPLANSFDAGERFHRFSLNPLDLMRAEKSAGQAGMLVLGFYHSHPDHPARPSEYDRQHAWPFYSYLIVSIAEGKAVDMTCWVLQEPSMTFARQDVVEEEDKP